MRWVVSSPLAVCLAACSEYGIQRNEETTGPGGVEGRICDPSGQGYVVGAEVTLTHDIGTIDTTTDASGAFTLTGVPVGSWPVDVTKGSFSTRFAVAVERGEVVRLPDEQCLDAASASIGVITGGNDAAEEILDELGIAYDVYDGLGISLEYLELLESPERLATYDILLFDCGFNDLWLLDEADVLANVVEFVEAGGSIYASDWAYTLVERAFPDAMDFYGDDAAFVATVGNAVDADVRVVDANLRATVGADTAHLEHGPVWVVVVAAGPVTDVLLEGFAPVMGGVSVEDAPFATRFRHGEGQVTYTSFHNEPDLSGVMRDILHEIVLSL
jgi:hypothetical protein